MASKLTKCFDKFQLEQFLNEQLDEQAESIVMDHVGECSQCQKALEGVAAGKKEWGELKDNLADHLDLDVTGETAPFESRDRDIEMEKLKEYLGPTDDPCMLGRLGIYEVCGLVGRGSTGVVVKALDTRLNRYVAIKVLSPSFSSNGPARTRFEREGRSVAAVSHEHVVPIHSVNEYRGLPFIVMHYVDGGSLHQRIEKNGPLENCEVVRIGMQIAKGLAAAHAQGIVHRDVKPANVMLENGVDRAMVSDFGLARVADEAAMTRSGVIAGTPQYMSPEQAMGDPIDQRSDLFSLGSVLYAACTGRAPFRSETVFGVIKRVCESEPRPIREINPEIAPWLEALITKLHQKDRQDRFESADQVAEILNRELAFMQSPSFVAEPDRPWVTVPPTKPVKETCDSGSFNWTTTAVAAMLLMLATFAGLFMSGQIQLGGNKFTVFSMADSDAGHDSIAECVGCEENSDMVSWPVSIADSSHTSSEMRITIIDDAADCQGANCTESTCVGTSCSGKFTDTCICELCGCKDCCGQCEGEKCTSSSCSSGSCSQPCENNAECESRDSESGRDNVVVATSNVNTSTANTGAGHPAGIAISGMGNEGFVLIAKSKFPLKGKTFWRDLDEYESVIENSFDVRSDGKFILRTHLGNVNVKTIDSEKVEVKLIRVLAAESKEQAQAVFDAQSIEYDHKALDLELGADAAMEVQLSEEFQKEMATWENGVAFRTMQFEIGVPKSFNVDLQTTAGHINVPNLDGVVNLKTSGGHIELEGCSKKAEIKTSGGHLTIGSVSGNLVAKTSGGHINVENVEGKAKLDTSGGHINIANSNGAVDARTSGGNINVKMNRQPIEDMELRSSAGSVTVILQRDLDLDVIARCSNGSIGGSAYRGKKGRSKAEFSINEGGPELNIRTSAGNIKVDYEE